jgi:hypothetical protein
MMIESLSICLQFDQLSCQYANVIQCIDLKHLYHSFLQRSELNGERSEELSYDERSHQ